MAARVRCVSGRLINGSAERGGREVGWGPPIVSVEVTLVGPHLQTQKVISAIDLFEQVFGHLETVSECPQLPVST